MQGSHDHKPDSDHEHQDFNTLDLSFLPPTYVLATHLSIDEQHKAENTLSLAGAPVTYDVSEAKILLGNITRRRRAQLELQWKGLHIADTSSSSTDNENEAVQRPGLQRSGRKRRHKQHFFPSKAPRNHQNESSTGSESADEGGSKARHMSQHLKSDEPDSHVVQKDGTSRNSDSIQALTGPKDKVIVIALEWLNASVLAHDILPIQPFLLLKGRLEKHESQFGYGAVMDPTSHEVLDESSSRAARDLAKPLGDSTAILERAKSDAKPSFPRARRQGRVQEAADRDIKGKSFSSSTQAGFPRAKSHHQTRPISLKHQTTSENEESTTTEPLPPQPDWVVQNKIYSCERSTPLKPLNVEFVDLLKEIRVARQLTLDEIGVRAYSTSIASLSAYPYVIRSSREILALPGCDQKIAFLFTEYKENDGRLQAVDEIHADPALKVLQEFFQIWGVGATTAREFYYDKGWRDLDDIIEYGWAALSRVQQIGLKYYDEFQLKIPRQEVEDIAAIITRHAAQVTNDKLQCAIVGGYRRGNAESGDVDVILSHPDETQTLNIIEKIVTSLETEGWITHTLTLHFTNSHRNQETLPINPAATGHNSFDSLDKALVVWQDPSWPSKEADLAENPKAKNPSPHRRVDIIISPWRTIGCAVAGWTSGTTFQRDLRRYCKYVKGWKFDSSGVRVRGSGRWVDLEGWRDKQTRCTTWQQAEKRVFKGLGLEWREPWERCTG